MYVVAVLALGGCTTPEPTPAERVQAAAAALDQLQSLHFRLQVEGGPAYLDTARTLTLRQAEGDVVRPDRSQVAARVGVGGIIVNMRFISVGDRGYMTDPLAGRWLAAPAELVYNAAYLFEPDAGVAAMLRRLKPVSRAGEASIGSVATVQLTGESPATDLTVLTGGAMRGDRVRVDLWVARDANVLHQVRLTELGPAGSPLVWTLTLSAHDQPVTIDPPL